MGFNKRYLDKDRIVSAFQQDGAKGVTDLYRADAIILEGNSPMCNYIDKVICKDIDIKKKHELIEQYMLDMLEGLYPFK